MLVTRTLKAAACFAIGCGAIAPSMAQETAITLPASAPFPESLAASADGALYTGSMTNGGILRVAPGSSTAETWVQPGAFDTRSIFGVLADDARGVLWVCSNDASGMGIEGPNSVEGAFVKSFDLATGEGRDSVPLPTQPAICNDLAIGPDGALYVTNTAQPQILRLPPGAGAMEVWAEDARLAGGLDGLAFGTDGALYVNTFISGELFRIGEGSDQAGDIQKVETPRPLLFPDGMKPHGEGFLLVEGSGPLSRLTISDGTAALTAISDFADPSGLAVIGDDVWISEGRIADLMNPENAGKLPQEFTLRSVPLH